MPLNNQNSKSAGCKNKCRVKEKHGFSPNSKKKEPVGTCRYIYTVYYIILKIRMSKIHIQDECKSDQHSSLMALELSLFTG